MDRESIDFINKVIADQTEKFFKFSVLHNKYLFRTQMGSEQLQIFLRMQAFDEYLTIFNGSE